MPYIKKEFREGIAKINHGYLEIYPQAIDNAGDMQFAIAILIKFYIQNKGLNYQKCNDIMGALAGAQMEFYRRTVAPFEDEAIKRNGDI